MYQNGKCGKHLLFIVFVSVFTHNWQWMTALAVLKLTIISVIMLQCAHILTVNHVCLETVSISPRSIHFTRQQRDVKTLFKKRQTLDSAVSIHFVLIPSLSKTKPSEWQS